LKTACLKAGVFTLFTDNDAAPPPDPAQLLALVDSLLEGTLNAAQLEPVRALRAGMLSLTKTSKTPISSFENLTCLLPSPFQYVNDVEDGLHSKRYKTHYYQIDYDQNRYQ